MSASTADALILDDEDFTPLARKDRACALTPALLKRWRRRRHYDSRPDQHAGCAGPTDLEAAIPAKPDFVLYPMASNADEMAALDKEISRLEKHAGLPTGCFWIVPVCETALGVADVRLIVKGSERSIMALLGAGDLAADLQAERSRDGYELDYARRRFVFECRAAGIKPNRHTLHIRRRRGPYR